MNALSLLRRNLFSSPYRWLPAAVFVFYIVSFALHPFSPLRTYHLADPDDYMRLDEVISWLQGQGWYDLSVPRLGPGAHTIIHWARLIDVPIALLALPFIHSFGVPTAVLIAAMIVPLIWFAVLLALTTALAHLYLGKDDANFSSLMVLFAPLLLFNYAPGRVDHHGVQILVAGFGLLSLSHICLDKQGSLFAVLSALVFACGFWIGAEALPFAILFLICLSVCAAWQGGRVSRHGALFGFCFAFFTLALIPVALPRSEFSTFALSWFSPAYVVLAFLTSLSLIVGWTASFVTTSRFVRLIIYFLCGFCAVTTFFAFVPSALQGPFTDYDTFDATTALDNITEAQPLIHALHFNRYMPLSLVPPLITFLRFLFLPIIAAFFCVHMVRKERMAMRFLWLTQSLFLFCTIGLTLFWQLRVGTFMEFFALIPLSKMLCVWWERLKWGLWDRPLFWAEIGVFLLLGFLPVYFIPVLVSGAPLYPTLVLFPAARAAPSCALEPIIPFLTDPKGLGAKSLTIMNTSDTGPQILFATSHKVLAGNFDVASNADVYDFFHTSNDTKALADAKKWGVDLVLLCQTAPMLYLGKDYYALSHVQLKTARDGLLHLTNTDPNQPLIERLIKGQNPSWLKPIEIPDHSDYLLFRIEYPKGRK